MNIHVFETPEQANDSLIRESACVVIDVLRMTSTACHALSNGAGGILMKASAQEAMAQAKAHGALLGGERGGVIIPGFDFGNSPLEYTQDRVYGKRIVMSTSNGTKAVEKAKGARRLLLSSFINVSACAKALSEESNVVILCAGTEGRFSLDDALCAGALAFRLNAREQNDLAHALSMLYASERCDIDKAVSRALHYQRLVRLGFTDDLRFCLQEDTCKVCPEIGEDGWFH